MNLASYQTAKPQDRSIGKNQERFGYSDTLRSILERTARRLFDAEGSSDE